MTGWVWFWAAYTVAAAVPSAEGAETSQTEDAPAKVVEVSFEGVEDVDEGALAAGLANHPPTGFLFFKKKVPLDRTSLRLDEKRVEAFLARRGWFEARVVAVDVSWHEDDPERASVLFSVEQGPRTRVVGIDLVGDPFPEGMPSDERMREALPAKPGDPAIYSKYQAGISRLRELLVSRGFVHAKVEAVMERKIGVPEARIEYEVDPGPLTRFGPLTLDVSGGIPESAVRSRIAFKEGDRFDPNLIELTEGRLFDLPVVGSVQIEWTSKGRPNPLPVTVVVRPGVPRELRLGGGVARDNVNLEVRLRGSYRQANFFHPLQTFSAELRPAFVFRDDLGQPALNITASTELRRDDFIAARIRGTLGVRYDIIQYEAVQNRGPQVSVALARPLLLDRLQLRTSVSFSFVDPALSFFPEDRDLSLDRFGIFEREALQLPGIPPAPTDLRIRRPADLMWVTWAVEVSYDQRDNPRSPRLGYYLQFSNEISQLFDPGAWYWFVKPEARGYLPLGSRLVLAGRLRWAMEVFRTDPAPFPLRLFAGGAQSQRGFANRRLAPSVRNTNGDLVPLGGEVLLESNVELRLDLFRLFGSMFGMVAFLDGADSVLNLEDLDPLNLHWAAGAGLRYRTPIGPLRFDIGFRLNRTDGVLPAEGLERLAWHISLGEAF
ncbi:MAG TPA: BamA/TamA family outer membrane protein [Myxococcales bacterium LLY-WYZ-16_1]|nr:BamA/TamA family outer membrane protein [Myxococcales bacterium LLY-WYZ-16_1]